MAQWINDPNRITYLAATHTRGKHVAFGIRAKDRDKHMYIIGKSGMGKSTLLENMAIQDIQNGEGIAFVDPHGSSAEKLLDFVPQDRIKDVVYFAPFDTEYPIGFNVLEDVGYDNRHQVVSGLMGTFERIWADAWSARMQYILQNTLLALLEYPGSTLIDVNRMLVNKSFREEVISKITDPIVAAFWKEEFANYTDRYTQEATPAIQNKIGQFVSNPLIRNIIGQPTSSFDIRKLMDEQKILIVNLSKGRMGETNSALLGSMIVIKIYLAALSRAEDPREKQALLPPFYFYVDEFQSVVNNAFEGILSEARKYKLGLVIAHQYIEQMTEEVRNAVFGNVGTTVIFRVGPLDAEFLKTVFEPTFMAEDMVNLGLGNIYLTLMIDGVGSQPFSAQTLMPVEPPSETFRDDIMYYTQHRYGRARSKVENLIREDNDKWIGAMQTKHKSDSARGQQKSQYPPRKDEGSSFGTRPRPENHAPRKDPRAHADRDRNSPREEKQSHAPAATQKSPAEMMRSMKKTHTERGESHKHHRQDDNKSALKAAISAARPNIQNKQQTHNKPTNSSHKTHSKPQENKSVDPSALHTLLYGDDE